VAHARGRSSEAEHELPKLGTRVRFPSPALDGGAGQTAISQPYGTAGIGVQPVWPLHQFLTVIKTPALTFEVPKVSKAFDLSR
jgi:hypothetical protein